MPFSTRVDKSDGVKEAGKEGGEDELIDEIEGTYS